MKNCSECKHYHHQGARIMCDAGVFDVQIVGNPIVTVTMPVCDGFDPLPAIEAVIVDKRVDKRTKEYRNA